MVFFFQYAFFFCSIYHIRLCVVQCTVMPALCDPMWCSKPDFPVLPHFLETAQTHVQVNSYYQVAKVLELQLQHQSLQFPDFLQDLLVWSPCCPRNTQESSPKPQFNTTSILWCSALFMLQLSCPYMTTGKTIALTRRN